jgi:hypothetical protein
MVCAYEHLDWRVDKNDGKAQGSAIDLKAGIFNSEVNVRFSRTSLHHGVVLFSLSKNIFCLVGKF